jgi:hypothetical protein
MQCMTAWQTFSGMHCICLLQKFAVLCAPAQPCSWGAACLSVPLSGLVAQMNAEKGPYERIIHIPALLQTSWQGSRLPRMEALLDPMRHWRYCSTFRPLKSLGPANFNHSFPFIALKPCLACTCHLPTARPGRTLRGVPVRT